MSRNQLIDSYQTGQIGRRAFVKGLVGLGMSVSLATAMADKVRASSGPTSTAQLARAATDDTYDPGDPPVTTLPQTGAGEASNSSASVGKTLTVLGAGAAAVAGILRRKSNTAPDGDA